MAQITATRPATQRRISLLRHAKALPEDGGGDHARRLAPRGQDDAAALGAWLAKYHAAPELVLCSTAARTRETLAGLNMQVATMLSEKIYLASAGELLSLLQETDPAVEHVLLIGHNPAMHGIAALLAKDYVNDADADRLLTGMPTCGFVSMTVPLADWAQLQPQSATVDALRFDGMD